jgi:prepilin-type N-terminal cleavage/methylation domain-containing protein
MKKLQKGFTLVELIVVITILAILGTIAFISLQGYSQDAKNSKVTSDLRTLVSAIETGVTDGTLTLSQLTVSGSTLGTAATGDFASGATLTTGTNGAVGEIDFVALRQNGSDFLDPEQKGYIGAYASDPLNSDNTFYQIVGQTKNAAGTYDAVVKGNYIQTANADLNGLVADNANTVPLGVTNSTTGMSSTSPNQGLYAE